MSHTTRKFSRAYYTCDLCGSTAEVDSVKSLEFYSIRQTGHRQDPVQLETAKEEGKHICKPCIGSAVRSSQAKPAPGLGCMAPGLEVKDYASNFLSFAEGVFGTDRRRCTGRTSAMIKAAVEYAAENPVSKVVVVGHTIQMARQSLRQHALEYCQAHAIWLKDNCESFIRLDNDSTIAFMGAQEYHKQSPNPRVRFFWDHYQGGELKKCEEGGERKKVADAWKVLEGEGLRCTGRQYVPFGRLEHFILEVEDC